MAFELPCWERAGIEVIGVNRRCAVLLFTPIRPKNSRNIN